VKGDFIGRSPSGARMHGPDKNSDHHVTIYPPVQDL
jgi:hypothetical protein